MCLCASRRNAAPACCGICDGKCAAYPSNAFGGDVLPPALVLSNMPPLMWKEPKLRVRAVMSVELHDKDKSSDLKNIIIAQEAKQG